ncbi:hypothetical protein CBR_g31459 [Chara braunii]|uniref:Reverse transcriptase RNase H-like domain-containing protein n=1 Tax=Chara braunii TaxID=69332 RepID=A0A388LFA7_CHABU|nr:hypothetical protein CBR_g31459 [Chara braunii]|eukprot:GBG80903.1 hypothetical protein CBR_g31459 [Chara braunii]
MANLHAFLHAAVPAPLTEDGVAVVDIRAYLAKINREHASQRNQLAGEASINMHNFPSFNKKALDLEAKIGPGHNPTTDGRKKTLSPNWKAKGRIMFVDNDGSTIELDDNFQEGVGSEAGSVEALGDGVVAAVAQKVTTDARQYGIGVVLAQQEREKLRHVEYMSKKMSSHKLAKSTYEKELYAIYKALTHWRHYLLGRFFILRTDHQTLRWMRPLPVLTDALKRWIEVIEQYDFDSQYLKGEYNKVADALSCRPDFSASVAASRTKTAGLASCLTTTPGGTIDGEGDDDERATTEVVGRQFWDDERQRLRSANTSSITRGVARISVGAEDVFVDCDGGGGEEIAADDDGDDNDEDDDGEMEIRPVGRKGGGSRATTKVRESRTGRKGKKCVEESSTGDVTKSRDFWTVEHMIALIKAKKDQDLHLAGMGHNYGRMKTKTWKWDDVEKRLVQMEVTSRKAVDCGKKWDNLYQQFKSVHKFMGESGKPNFFTLTSGERRERGKLKRNSGSGDSGESQKGRGHVPKSKRQRFDDESSEHTADFQAEEVSMVDAQGADVVRRLGFGQDGVPREQLPALKQGLVGGVAVTLARTPKAAGIVMMDARVVRQVPPMVGHGQPRQPLPAQQAGASGVEKTPSAQKVDTTAGGSQMVAGDNTTRSGVAKTAKEGRVDDVRRDDGRKDARGGADDDDDRPVSAMVKRGVKEDDLEERSKLARNVEKVVLRTIHGRIFKSSSRSSGFARAQSYVIVDFTTDVARAVWQALEWSKVVSPALAYHTLAMKMNVPMWFAGLKIADRPEDDDKAARQEATVLRLADCWTDAVWCGQWADGGRVKQDRLTHLADCLRVLLSACMWIMGMGGDNDRSHYEASFYTSMVAKPTLIAAGSYIFNWRREIVDTANHDSGSSGEGPPHAGKLPLRLGVKVMSAQAVKDVAEVSEMLLKGTTVDQDIVEVDESVLLQNVPENVVHLPLQSSGCVETESFIHFASKEDGCTPRGIAGFNETQSQDLLKLTLEFGGLEDRESKGCLVVNVLVRQKLDGVLDIAHRWNAGVRERRWKNVVVLSNEVTNCGLRVGRIACEFLDVNVSARRQGDLDERLREGRRDGSHGDRRRICLQRDELGVGTGWIIVQEIRNVHRKEGDVVLPDEVRELLRRVACPGEGGEGELEALGHSKSRVVQVVVDGLAEVEVVTVVTFRRQWGNNVLLTILECAEAAREVAALLRGTAGATAERGTALGSVVRGGGGVTSMLRLGGGSGLNTGPHPLMGPSGLRTSSCYTTMRSGKSTQVHSAEEQAEIDRWLAEKRKEKEEKRKKKEEEVKKKLQEEKQQMEEVQEKERAMKEKERRLLEELMAIEEEEQEEEDAQRLERRRGGLQQEQAESNQMGNIRMRQWEAMDWLGQLGLRDELPAETEE